MQNKCTTSKNNFKIKVISQESLYILYEKLQFTSNSYLEKDADVSIAKEECSSEKQTIILVEFQYWINLVLDAGNRMNICNIKNYSFYKDLIERNYKLIMSLCLNNMQNNSDFEANILQGIDEVLELYKMFVEELKFIQVKMLKMYKYNVQSSPRLLIPFSEGINKLSSSSILIIKDIEDEENNGKCSVSKGVLSDGVSRVGSLYKTNIMLYSYNKLPKKTSFKMKNSTNYTEMLSYCLPEDWNYLINTKHFNGYDIRLRALSDVYSQYRFVGKNQLELTEKQQEILGLDKDTYLINYPLAVEDFCKSVSNKVVILPLRDISENYSSDVEKIIFSY